MNLDLIRSFTVLGHTCHYGEAARALGVSQPSLTKQIRRLEDLLGAPLFTRGRQGTKLTPFGRQFLNDTRPILALSEQVWQRGLRSATGERGRLAVGFTFSAVAAMSSVLDVFARDYPEIELAFDDVASDTQVDRIREGVLDVGFVRMPVPPDLQSRRIGADRLALLYPAAWQDRIQGLDSPAVRDMPFIALRSESSPGLERHVHSVLRHYEVEPRLVHRVGAAMTLISMVANRLGIALIHESAMVGLAWESIIVHPLAEPQGAWEVALAWRPGESNPVVLRFLHAARIILGGADTGDWGLSPLRQRRKAIARPRP
ncbi:LysR family transcriptional regulator [Tanticharoenia sakaeratensis]|jgi:DNA-binding transcriptional LysR family regulator|uniref:LysR family regulatory protein n=1 Tax=Tanticharoenia sakaeratensis NBRC 103193 TaxID=1231623 RepID=A0A0D6MKN8_9PROT|nr:LysR family transcriptional regulator [Tanticharoenia sakaeratensis]GAN54015.1 LysR family regulatory protein [Tanticharoenia sakaeratensis NBRC 103193]GBQ23596.1 LysR family transcriptional regulator [Tanticharoenia sakaeratensis NBRC 103193]